MYPLLRFAAEFVRVGWLPKLTPGDVHVSHHRVWPWDIDPWMELNHGRMLTLYDLGRVPMAKRMGFLQTLRDNGWGLTVAGVSVRYRRRITTFSKIEMRSAAIGRDERFIYMLQTMWQKGEAASSALYRVAVFTKDGIVPTDKVAKALGHPDWKPDLPGWVTDWIKADGGRTWPPVV
jgi:acyl-CoA thioesterase FadM